MEALLEARGLVKSYGAQRVVDGVDLDCAAGSVLGLLGPNGAGKTTTLRMLYGLIAPDAGTIRCFGLDFAGQRAAVKRRIGVCTQDDTLDDEFDVRRNLTRFAGYYRPPVEDLARRVDELLARFGLIEHAAKKPEQLSGGYRRRLMIARAVIHRPRLLFLDEPTTGLDPQARVEVWKLIDALRGEGLGIVLTTHYMDEAERLSDGLVVLAKGRAVARGAPKAVIGEVIGQRVAVLRADSPQRGELEAWARGHGLSPTGVLDELHLALRDEHLGEFGARFAGSGFTLREPTLDDLFLKLAVPA